MRVRENVSGNLLSEIVIKFCLFTAFMQSPLLRMATLLENAASISLRNGTKQR